MRRDTFGSLEGASDVISFLFCRNFRIPMRRQFSRFLVDLAVVLVVLSRSSVKEMIGIFFDSKNNVRMVIVKTFKQIIALIFLFLGETIINIPVIEWWVKGSNNI